MEAQREAQWTFSQDAMTVIVYPGSLKTWTTPPRREELALLPEAFERFWHVNDKQYKEYAGRCGSREGAVRDEAKRAGAEEVFARAARTETQRDIAEMAKTIEKLPEGLRQACRTVANTTLGMQRESQGLEMFAEQYGVKVEKPADRYTAVVAVAPDFIIQVRGRVDGVATLEGERVVLEVKTRTRRLSRRVGPERPQLEMYLRLLNCERGMLVETYGNTMQATPYARNDEYYGALMARLKAFVRRFLAFVRSKEAKRRYTEMTEWERAEYVAEMIRGYAVRRP